MISNKLNNEGVKSKKGGIWYDGSLYNMMKIHILKKNYIFVKN